MSDQSNLTERTGEGVQAPLPSPGRCAKTVHCSEAVKKRIAKSEAHYAQEHEARQRVAAAQDELERRAACFPELLTALQSILLMEPTPAIKAMALTAIAKAQGASNA